MLISVCWSNSAELEEFFYWAGSSAADIGCSNTSFRSVIWLCIFWIKDGCQYVAWGPSLPLSLVPPTNCSDDFVQHPAAIFFLVSTWWSLGVGVIVFIRSVVVVVTYTSWATKVCKSESSGKIITLGCWESAGSNRLQVWEWACPCTQSPPLHRKSRHTQHHHQKGSCNGNGRTTTHHFCGRLEYKGSSRLEEDFLHLTKLNDWSCNLYWCYCGSSMPESKRLSTDSNPPLAPPLN